MALCALIRWRTYKRRNQIATDDRIKVRRTESSKISIYVHPLSHFLAGPRNKFGQAPSNQISSGHHFEEPFFSNGDLNQIFDAVSNTEENKPPGGGGGGGSNCKCSQCGSPERRASNSLVCKYDLYLCYPYPTVRLTFRFL